MKLSKKARICIVATAAYIIVPALWHGPDPVYLEIRRLGPLTLNGYIGTALIGTLNAITFWVVVTAIYWCSRWAYRWIQKGA